MSDDNPLSEFISRSMTRGYQGFVLYVRAGEALERVDEYRAEPGIDQRIYADAVANAEGFVDMHSAFVLKVEGEGEQGGPTRAFSVAKAPSPHVMDRYDTSDKATNRMLLEHIDRQNKLITGVLPQLVAASSQMVSGMSGYVGRLAETHGDAVDVLRHGKVDAVVAERQLLEDASRQERINKLLDMGLELAPFIMQNLAKGRGA